MLTRAQLEKHKVQGTVSHFPTAIEAGVIVTVQLLRKQAQRHNMT